MASWLKGYFMNKKWNFFVIAFVLLFIGISYSQAQTHKGISFQGVIKLPNGEYPTRSGLTVNSRVLSPNNCILREEQFTGVNVSNGYINIAIGTGSTGGYDPGFSMKKVMDNSAVITGLTCLNSDGTVNGSVTSFDPSSTNGARKFRLSVTIDSTPVVADFNMRAMAYAINSESLNGKTESNFVNTSTNITQTAAENWFASSVMGQLLSGTYVAPSATTAGNVSGTVAIANGGTGATTASGALTNLLPSQSGHAGKILTTDGTSASWVAPPASPVTSVASKTGAVTLDAADISDFSTAADARITAQKGQANGLATLDASGKVPSTQLALTAADIPSLDASKITSGTLTQNVSSSSVAGTTGSFTNLRIYDGTSEYLTMTLPTGGAGYSIKWPNAVGANGTVLQTDASGNLSWVVLPSAPVTSVAGKTGAVTLANTDISGLGTASTYNVPATGDAAATEVVKGNDSRLTGAFQSSTSLGGDLSGTLPNPSVVKIQGKAVAPTTYAAGQTLRYDGTNWINAVLGFADISGTVSTSQLPTIPVSKGGTGVTSITANRLLASDGTGNTVTPFTCGVGQLVTFDVSGVMGCTSYSSSGIFANGGNGFATSASLGTNDNYNLNFKTNGSTRMTVLANGDVGIGTTTPAAKLDVAGGVKIGSSTSCTATEEGTLRYNSTSKGMEFCNGSLWAAVGSTGGSNGLRSCATGNANDVMVAVGSWCVDKYEASVWSAADGSGTGYFTDSTTSADTDSNYPTGAANVPAGCNRNGAGCVQYAVSKPGVIPSRGVTWYQAAKFCANSGKQLIPDDLWQVAAIGTYDPGAGSGTGGTTGGSATDAAAARCNINTHNATWATWLKTTNGVRPTNRAGTTAGGTNACSSDYGVDDMVGNLWEWTSMNSIEAGTDTAGFSQGKNNSSGGPFSTADGTWNINGSAYGCDGDGTSKGTCGWKNNTPAAALRGGHWSDGAQAGVTALNLVNSGSVSSWSIGFRCARPR